MSKPGIAPDALDQLFGHGRTFDAWVAGSPVPDATLRRLVELVMLGPTSANCEPARFVFVRSQAAKARLKPCLDEGNVAQTMAAPVTAIVAYDLAFHDRLPQLFPHEDARSWFAGDPEKIRATAFRNGSLQGGYLILAARALGLDCGPMSGFDNDAVDAAFFAGTAVISNFLCNLGHGDGAMLRPRSPRLSFDEAASIV
jgi:3-hydroxypropanoate dehydrogenase